MIVVILLSVKCLFHVQCHWINCDKVDGVGLNQKQFFSILVLLRACYVSIVFITKIYGIISQTYFLLSWFVESLHQNTRVLTRVSWSEHWWKILIYCISDIQVLYFPKKTWLSWCITEKATVDCMHHDNLQSNTSKLWEVSKTIFHVCQCIFNLVLMCTFLIQKLLETGYLDFIYTSKIPEKKFIMLCLSRCKLDKTE